MCVQSHGVRKTDRVTCIFSRLPFERSRGWVDSQFYLKHPFNTKIRGKQKWLLEQGYSYRSSAVFCNGDMFVILARKKMGFAEFQFANSALKFPPIRAVCVSPPFS